MHTKRLPKTGGIEMAKGRPLSHAIHSSRNSVRS